MKKRIFLGLLALTFILSACTTNNKSRSEETSQIIIDSENKTTTQKDDNLNETNTEDKKALKDGEFELLNGEKYNLNDQKGKKVYIKYWASWCPICLSSLQELDDFSKEENDFEVVSLVSPNFLGEKPKEDFKEWFNGLEYKNIKILIDVNGKYISQFGINATPVNLIIDSNGEVVKVIPGQLEKDVIKQIFNEVK